MLNTYISYPWISQELELVRGSISLPCGKGLLDDGLLKHSRLGNQNHEEDLEADHREVLEMKTQIVGNQRHRQEIIR